MCWDRDFRARLYKINPDMLFVLRGELPPPSCSEDAINALPSLQEQRDRRALGRELLYFIGWIYVSVDTRYRRVCLTARGHGSTHGGFGEEAQVVFQAYWSLFHHVWLEFHEVDGTFYLGENETFLEANGQCLCRKCAALRASMPVSLAPR